MKKKETWRKPQLIDISISKTNGGDVPSEPEGDFSTGSVA